MVFVRKLVAEQKSPQNLKGEEIPFPKALASKSPNLLPSPESPPLPAWGHLAPLRGWALPHRHPTVWLWLLHWGWHIVATTAGISSGVRIFKVSEAFILFLCFQNFLFQ